MVKTSFHKFTTYPSVVLFATYNLCPFQLKGAEFIFLPKHGHISCDTGSQHTEIKISHIGSRKRINLSLQTIHKFDHGASSCQHSHHFPSCKTYNKDTLFGGFRLLN